MTLIDSNLIIHSIEPGYAWLRDWIATHEPAVSGVTLVEVLGFNRLGDEARLSFEQFFHQIRVLPVDQSVIDAAVRLRQMRKMSLGDALIAATALVHDVPLATRNLGDFAWIDGLALIDPVAPAPE